MHGGLSRTKRLVLSLGGAGGVSSAFIIIAGCLFSREELFSQYNTGNYIVALSSLPPTVYAYFRAPVVFLAVCKRNPALLVSMPGQLTTKLTMKLVPECMGAFAASIYTALYYKHAMRWPQQNFERRVETHRFGKEVKYESGNEEYWPRYETIQGGLVGHTKFIGMLILTSVVAFTVSFPVTLPCGWIFARGAIHCIGRLKS